MRRHILLCVIGITPQIVTETLYALAVAEGRPCPDEIHLVGSEESLQRARLELLAPDRAKLAELCRDYGLPLPRLDEHTMHVIRRDGEPVNDLRSAADNEAAADTILEVTRELTSDPQASVHFSIAGGRKTMTYYLGYCASLFGRPQDDMSHVLVNPPFEQSTEFFFPPREPRVIHDRTNRPHSTSDARIDLARVPFLRLRNKIPRTLLQDRRPATATANADAQEAEPAWRSFSRIVRILNTLDEGKLTLRLSPPTKKHGGLGYALSPAPGMEIADQNPREFATLWMMAMAAAAAKPEPITSATCQRHYDEHFVPVYRAIIGNGSSRASDRPKDESNFRDQIDKLNKLLRDEFGPGAHDTHGVLTEGRRPNTTYTLQLAPASITFEGAHLVQRSALPTAWQE